ncbi:uncharacterized protein LOC122497859 [Leptopilina heterotoma]|uniref:uncharacterized protein LOC122497859 n=1 Tax=Leptopilina heterotoma TaxID=63436 RepID=UPI001CA7D306|nr:uncharacterized protein LOC122497859 [Leptopilina heterotoma]
MDVENAANSLVLLKGLNENRDDLSNLTAKKHCNNDSHIIKPSQTHDSDATKENPSPTQRTKQTNSDTSDKTNTNTNQTLSYDNSLKSNCAIFIQRDPKSADFKEDLGPMSVGRILHPLLPNKIVEINQSGRGKVRVTVKSGQVANQLLNHPQLSSHGLIGIIPTSFVSCQGIMNDVDTDISVEEIIEYGEVMGPHVNKIKIIQAWRFNRKVYDEKTKEFKFVPSKTVLLTFQGTVLPQRVAVYKGSSPIRPYFPNPRICMKCFRFGHIAKHCRSQPRCKSCGENTTHDTTNPCPNTSKTPKCVNCSSPHLATSKDCPEFTFQKEIRTYATIHRLSFIEAKAILRPRNTETTPNSFNFSNFPQLGEIPAPSSTNQNSSQLFSDITNLSSQKRRSPMIGPATQKFGTPQSRKRTNSFYATQWNNGRDGSDLPNGFALSASRSMSNPSTSNTIDQTSNHESFPSFLISMIKDHVTQLSSSSSPEKTKHNESLLNTIIESILLLFNSVNNNINGSIV